MSNVLKSKEPLRAPFSWFGGKRAVADLIWERLGDVKNYVEPFFGSGAVLLARPHEPRAETISDADHYVANFWRAVKADPDAVAFYADHPVIESELSARHWWLITEGKSRLAEIEGNPDFFDPQIAGWWVWGTCAWIASGWCSGNGPWQWDGTEWQKNASRKSNKKLPHLGTAGMGVNKKLPHLGDAGMGVNNEAPAFGRRRARAEFISEWMSALADRLRDVRVAAGDWSRVCGPSVTHLHGLTGVFLDPPYGAEAGRTEGLYATDSSTVAAEARDWAIKKGTNPLMRIAFAGYVGEHTFPDEWTCVEWKACGGFGSQGNGKGRENSSKERLWFSPHCLVPQAAATLSLMEA